MPRQRCKRVTKAAPSHSQPFSQPSSQLFLRTPLIGPISRLPPELIGAIISQCCTSDEADKVTDKKTLLSTSRVSHLWRAESVRYLFRSITITCLKLRHVESLKPFLEFLNCSPLFRPHIVQLRLKQRSLPKYHTPLPLMDDKDVARIVQLLPNLDSLDIELTSVKNTGAKDDSRDMLTATPNGKLVINHLSIQQPTSPVGIVQYLSHFSKIKTLRIIADGTKCNGSIPNLIPYSTLEVESLELTAYSAYLDTLRPIIQPSSLTSLVLNAVSKIDTTSLYAFLNDYGAHLQSFEYVAQNAPEDITVLGRSCLSTCTQLRTVSFFLRSYVRMTIGAGVEPSVAEWNACMELITSISAELEHVKLTIPVSDDTWFSGLDLYEVQEALISLSWTSIKDVIEKFPTLQQVEVVLVTGSGFLETDDIAKIQNRVRSKLGEKTMKKVNIYVVEWAGDDNHDFDEWNGNNGEVYEYNSDDATYAGSSFQDSRVYNGFDIFDPGYWETWDD